MAIKVLHVIGFMDRGGAETLIMNLMRSIDREHVQFDFLVQHDGEADYDAEIRQLGGTIYHIPTFTGTNALSYRMACRRFFSEHHDYQVVHGHIGSCAAIYLSEAKRWGIPTVAHSHSQNFPLSPSELAFRMLSHPTRRVADYFLACSTQAGIDRYGRAVVESDHFYVLKNGIDVKRYRCDETIHQQAKIALGYGPDTLLFGHVGRFVAEKNHVFLLRAFARIARKEPSSRLVLVGRGPLLDDVLSQAQEEGISEKVDYLGVRDDVPEVLKAVDAFVFPSTSEGLGIAFIEAQATGLPCLTSTGVPEEAIVTDHAWRLPLDVGTQAWADRALQMARTDSGRSDDTDKVRAAGYDIQNSAEWLTRLYEELAG